jgi:asparagine synthase (glutamine-hydrolysing)
MCGIAGFLSFDGDAKSYEDAVQRMTVALEHRGPDFGGLFSDADCVLGHRRLSIIDRSPEANQPMQNEDGSIWLVVNGEIYNFMELRKELEAKGHKFRSRSDSEVIIHLYEEMGTDFVGKLRGMFAIALWDKKNKTLILARDRFGKKPLFYWRSSRGIAFASEVQALVASRLFEPEADIEAIVEYLTLQYVPAPKSAFLGVRKIEPGTIVVCDANGKIKNTKYYEVRVTGDLSMSVEDIARLVRSKVEEAVRIRLYADVPLGAFLSGGIDSSIVVGCMAHASGNKVQTFSIGFPAKDQSELDYARIVARHFDTDHHEMIVEPNMVAIVDRIVHHYGEPYADTSAVPTWYLSQFTKSHVTVALSGDAGDEGFGGYRRYLYMLIASRLKAVSGKALPAIAHILQRLPFAGLEPVRTYGQDLLKDEMTRYLGLIGHLVHPMLMRLFSPDMKARFLNDAVHKKFVQLWNGCASSDLLDRLMEIDLKTYLPDDILVKVDIASMAHALEVRCPLLDHEVIEIASRIPSSLKRTLFDGKVVLKKAFADMLPQAILRRGKKGFSLPIDRWMREDLFEMARDTLTDATFKQRGLFDADAISRLLLALKGGKPLGLQVWNLMMLELWFRHFIDKRVKT